MVNQQDHSVDPFASSSNSAKLTFHPGTVHTASLSMWVFLFALGTEPGGRSQLTKTCEVRFTGAACRAVYVLTWQLSRRKQLELMVVA
jgi:hypothetical protein